MLCPSPTSLTPWRRDAGLPDPRRAGSWRARAHPEGFVALVPYVRDGLAHTVDLSRIVSRRVLTARLAPGRLALPCCAGWNVSRTFTLCQAGFVLARCAAPRPTPYVVGMPFGACPLGRSRLPCGVVLGSNLHDPEPLSSGPRLAVPAGLPSSCWVKPCPMRSHFHKPASHLLGKRRSGPSSWPGAGVRRPVRGVRPPRWSRPSPALPAAPVVVGPCPPVGARRGLRSPLPPSSSGDPPPAPPPRAPCPAPTPRGTTTHAHGATHTTPRRDAHATRRRPVLRSARFEGLCRCD